MKSEHRHELQSNSLAAALTNLPETLRKHSSKILTVLALILLVVAAVRYKRSQDAAREYDVRLALAGAWNTLGVLAQANDPRLTNLERQSRFDSAEESIKSAVQKVIDDSDPTRDRARLAGAYLVSGELYWTLANDSPLATTRPATQPTTRPTNYLDLSQAAYQKIVADFADQAQALEVARFSLAAIAENRQDWKAARDQYKAIIESDSATPTGKALAESRITLVDQLQQPLLRLPATQPVLSAADELNLQQLPSLQLGATPPTTAPTTQP